MSLQSLCTTHLRPPCLDPDTLDYKCISITEYNPTLFNVNKN